MENDNRQDNEEGFVQGSGQSASSDNGGYSQGGFGQMGQSGQGGFGQSGQGGFVQSGQNDGYSQGGMQNNGYAQPSGQNNGYSQNTGYNQEGFQPSGTYQSPQDNYSQSTVPVSQSMAFAIAGMVLGIISILCCCAWYISFFIAAAGMVFSIIALVKNMPGRGMALAGAICSGIGLLLAIILGIMVMIGFRDDASSAQQYRDFIEQFEDL